MISQAKIALVYDRVNTAHGGAEAVLLALKKLYPQADLFTAVYDARRAAWAKEFRVFPSFLQKIPFAKKHHRLFLPLMPLAFETLDLSAYQVVISVTSAEAKAVVTRSDQLHVCYLLTPPRYLYHYQENYWQSQKALNWPIIQFLSKLVLRYLKKYDQLAARRPEVIIPIAEVVRERIKKYYQDLPTYPVIYPPVDVQSFQAIMAEENQIARAEQNNSKTHQYFLVVSRLVPYKNIDLAIRACVKAHQQLIIVGDGPDYRSLRQLADSLIGKNSSQIIFRRQVNQAELSQLYGHAKALLMPGIDDFGITALEANLHALPVIINQHSGAAEVLKDGETALHLNFPENIGPGDKEATIEELSKQMAKIDQQNFDPALLRKNALKYDTTSFIRKFNQAVETAYRKKFND